MTTMNLSNVKRRLEELLGHEISRLLFLQCLDAFPCGHHGPVGLGAFAFMRYFPPFQKVLGEEFKPGVAWFFCGHDENGEEIRHQIYPYRINAELLPLPVRNAYKEVYGYEPSLLAVDTGHVPCKSWYYQFIWHLINTGIPEESVIDIIKTHPVPVSMVRRYGFSSGLVPETIANNILRICGYTPKTATPQAVKEYRKRFEEDFRRYCSSSADVEDVIRIVCESDKNIERLIINDLSVADLVKALSELSDHPEITVIDKDGVV